MEPENTFIQSQIEALYSDIVKGHFKNIIIISGAGVSTSSGIPDYRSDKGQFSTLGMDIFSNRSLYNEKRGLSNMFDGKKPTVSHYLAVLLNEKGLLRRVYTQNIDGLYQSAGLSEDMIVEAHGNHNRGDVVLYGEGLPARFIEMVGQDFVSCKVPPDLILVMGTSLQVAPFSALPNLVDKNCTRVLITKNIQQAMKNDFNREKGSHAVKFMKRRVTVRSQWGLEFRSRWPKQYLLDYDVEVFSKDLIHRLNGME